MTEEKLIYPNFPENLIKSQFHLNRYIKFIDSRPIREKSKDLYTENHHKVPNSLGGSKESKNMIRLAGREHFIAHLILWKAFGGPMIHAFNMMKMNNQDKRYFKLASKQYEQLRIDYSNRISKQKKNIPFTEEQKKRRKEVKKQELEMEQMKKERFDT